MPGHGELQFLLVPSGEKAKTRDQAEEYGLDDDEYGYYCTATMLRNMGAFSDGEWEEMIRDWSADSEAESSGPQEPAAVADGTTAPGALHTQQGAAVG